MQFNTESNVAGGYDLTRDHPGYDLPKSNITYHLYPEDRTDNQAVAQKAFQRIMDSYEEFEKLTDVFQVEFDRREQLVKERKERDKRLREERQRQLKEERRCRRLGKHKSQQEQQPRQPSLPPSPSVPRTPLQHYQYHPYHPYSGMSQHAAFPPTDPGRGPSISRAFGGHGFGHSQGSFLRPTSVESHSQLKNEHPPHLIHGASLAGERSPSSSPVLPLTPSPQLGASHSMAGLATSTSAVPQSVSSSSSTTPFSFSESISSIAGASTSGTQQHPERIRKKRKQAIPVHPSIVDRIPGITLRIQPDTEQQLQVEILKNVDDYQTATNRAENAAVASDRVHEHQRDDEHNDGNMDDMSQSMDDQSTIGSNTESQNRLEAKQDLEKLLESIESGRPGYAFFQHPLKERDIHGGNSTPRMDMDTDMDAFAKSGLSHHSHQKHQRQSSATSSRSLELYDPTGARLSNAAADYKSGFQPNSAASHAGTPTFDVFAISNMALDDIRTSRAALPLSWDNFPTRNCRVNKVIGNHDREFELLEEVVQEAIARQQAAYTPSDDEESPDHSQDRNQNRRVSHHQNDREGSASTNRSTPPVVFTRASGSRASAKRSSVSAQSSTTTFHPTATRAIRGGVSGLVQTYDDIEKVLKEKRLRKREERRRQEGGSREISEATTDPDHEMEQEHKAGDDRDSHNVKSECLDLRMNRMEAPDKISNRLRKKSLTLFTASEDAGQRAKASMIPSSKRNSPPSPPHSRQVTPSKGELTTTSRRSSFSSNARSITYTAASRGSDTSSTPPATPTRATAPPPPPLFGPSQQGPTVAGRTRTRQRSISDTTTAAIPPHGKNSFFDSALEQIEAKRRQQIEKKRAATAAAAAAAAAAASAESPASTSNDHPGATIEQDAGPSALEGEGKEVGSDDRAANDITESNQPIGPSNSATAEFLLVNDLDPHALERELHNLEYSKGMESTTGNLPKSSKFLPGRVLRKARPRAQDLQYVTDASNVGLSSGSVSTADRGHRESMADDDEMLDPDCTSCRLVLNGFDKLLWKQARQAGEVNLNPKRWGKTAILCIACRMQYQRHHLRCTQCFYVPVIAEEMLGRPGAPKAGGTCSRCRAGTWLQEKDC